VIILLLTMQSEKRYTILKWITAGILSIHLIARLVFPTPNILIDLIGFNIDLTGDASESLRRADLAMYEAKRSKSGVLLWELGRKI
jgi:hypothetical protein